MSDVAVIVNWDELTEPTQKRARCRHCVDMLQAFIAGVLTGVMVVLILLVAMTGNQPAPARPRAPYFGRQYL